MKILSIIIYCNTSCYAIFKKPSTVFKYKQENIRYLNIHAAPRSFSFDDTLYKNSYDI